jgi:hypothetical protein
MDARNNPQYHQGLSNDDSNSTELQPSPSTNPCFRRYPWIERFWHPNDELKLETFDTQQLKCVKALTICWRFKCYLLLLNLFVLMEGNFALSDQINFVLSFLWFLLPVFDLYTWYRWAMNGVITGSINDFYLCFAAASVHLMLIILWALGVMAGSYGWIQLFQYGSQNLWCTILIVIESLCVSAYAGLFVYTFYVLYKFMKSIGAPLSEPLEPA